MIVTDRIDEVRKHRWADPSLTWGFVPTMGYLHAGHLSLVQLSLAGNDRTAVSIYVNPTQFAPTEDLSSYPRNLAGDLAMLEAAGVDLVFTPSDAIMYPPGFQTTVSLSQVTQPLEGSSRPTHFAGVATVVAKLFNIVQPTRAYFGQKDAQQTIVLRQMVRDLNFNVEMIIGPTSREQDGLAMSSRNARLSEDDRAAAPVLYRALSAAQTAVANGEQSGEVLREMMRGIITAVPQARIDYVSAADPKTLEELEVVESGVLLSTAVFFGKTRLIDNILIYATENTEKLEKNL
ncbi:MAG: pantoate--beta-alanine ligase [Ardenticatenaceae bacterium]|nr:pantoate--beta-alanine ligase [Anaerolineales bacterium]MCB8941791.1 pantoate--beta-alanine ligase [Ardenticatenaceae bacterium]MCB8972903.1 pantoate--beta-alanine ligase [Ardenticatenaceae bacterium]